MPPLSTLSRKREAGEGPAKADSLDMSKREESKYKINRRLGVNLWGRAKSPLEPPRIRSRPARPAAQEAVGLRHAAFGQAEAEGLLRQYRRAPVPPPLRGGRAAARRHRREFDRAAGAPARRDRLSHEAGPDPVRRPPAGQSRPRAGQRQPGQHPVLSAARRRHDRAAPEARRRWRWSSRRASRASATCPIISRSTTSGCAAASFARRSWPTCPFRYDGAQPRRRILFALTSFR